MNITVIICLLNVLQSMYCFMDESYLAFIY